MYFFIYTNFNIIYQNEIALFSAVDDPELSPLYFLLNVYLFKHFRYSATLLFSTPGYHTIYHRKNLSTVDATGPVRISLRKFSSRVFLETIMAVDGKPICCLPDWPDPFELVRNNEETAIRHSLWDEYEHLLPLGQ